MGRILNLHPLLTKTFHDGFMLLRWKTTVAGRRPVLLREDSVMKITLLKKCARISRIR